MTSRALALLATSLILLTGCGGASQNDPKAPTQTHEVPNQIIGPRAEGTVKELLAKGEQALLMQKWQEAVDAFEAVIGADPVSANNPQIIYDLGVAYEGLGEREKARARFRDLARRFPDDKHAKHALSREVSLDAYLEDWKALGEVGEAILARKDADPVEKMLGHGARGLSRVLAGDENGASRDIQAGLDIVEEHRYGQTGQLPVAAAMLKFANGELRKYRSEKISLNPPGPDFVLKLEMRCAMLLEAQSAFADAIRSVDPHWAAMSGFRVGDMYRTLHHDLMLIPPNDKAKTEHDKQLFYGIMHVRYRVLLEKGIEMMKRTLGLGEKTGAASGWMKRAEASKAEMEKALEEEHAMIKKFPFTEEELQKALEIMKKKAQDDQAKVDAQKNKEKK